MAKFAVGELAGIEDVSLKIHDCVITEVSPRLEPLQEAVAGSPPYYRVHIFGRQSGSVDGTWVTSERWLRKKNLAPDLAREKETSLV